MQTGFRGEGIYSPPLTRVCLDGIGKDVVAMFPLVSMYVVPVCTSLGSGDTAEKSGGPGIEVRKECRRERRRYDYMDRGYRRGLSGPEWPLLWRGAWEGGGALLLGSPVDNGALGVPAGALGCRGGGSRSEDCWSQERDFLRNIAWIIQFFILMHTHAYVRMLIYYRCV